MSIAVFAMVESPIAAQAATPIREPKPPKRRQLTAQADFVAQPEAR